MRRLISFLFNSLNNMMEYNNLAPAPSDFDKKYRTPDFDKRKFHCEDGPIIFDDGSEEWWWNDQLHRVDGPAVTTAKGSQIWYVSSRKHRADGPAVIWKTSQQVEWWYFGREYDTEEDWFKALTLEEKRNYIWNKM